MININGHTILTGVLAHPIRHSKSPLMHNNAFAKLHLNYVYLAFDAVKRQFPDAVKAIKALDMRGINVSMPYKQAIIPYMDHLDRTASLSHAVNTVVNDHGVLTGYTTDGIGFANSLLDHQVSIKDKKIIIAGAGGAATPIMMQLSEMAPKQIIVFNRKNGKSFAHAQHNVNLINQEHPGLARLADLNQREVLKKSLQTCDIFCDATSVGMGPLRDQSLVTDPTWFHPHMVVYDTVYAHLETKLMRVAKKGHVDLVLNGLGMLLDQGAASFKLWTGKDMPVTYIKKLLFNSIK